MGDNPSPTLRPANENREGEIKYGKEDVDYYAANAGAERDDCERFFRRRWIERLDSVPDFSTVNRKQNRHRNLERRKNKKDERHTGNRGRDTQDGLSFGRRNPYF